MVAVYFKHVTHLIRGWDVCIRLTTMLLITVVLSGGNTENVFWAFAV